MTKMFMLTVILLLICPLIVVNNAFNLAPHPHIVLREPNNLKTFMPKVRSSYFGYAINLKKDR